MHRFYTRSAAMAVALVLAFALALALGCTVSVSPQQIREPGPPEPTATPHALEFPTDHGPHAADTEWWYYSGHATSELGRSYGFHVALFRTDGGESGRHYDRVQASVIDLEAGARWDWTHDGVSDSTQPAAATDSLLDVTVGDARLQVNRDGSHSLSVSDPATGTGIDLSLAPSDAVMLHDDIGWIPFPFGYSYYYTQPRLTATGTMTIGNGGASEVVDLQGEVWYDHQWGDFIVLGWPGGWYWIGLHMDDGSSLMLSEVRDTDGGRYRLFGTHLGADGRQRTLDEGADGIELEHLEHWTSDVTGAEYPISSRVRVATLGLDMIIVPRAVDQETVTSIGGDRSATYWEGSVVVTDSASGEPLGQGYLELAGYVQPEPLGWRDE